MNTKTAEERAEDRFPAFKVMDWTRRQDGYATCIREEVEPLEAELDKINDVLNYRGMELSASAAVKWISDEYGEICQALQVSCQKHKLGLGGENVGRLHVEAVDRLTEENAKLRALVQELVNGLEWTMDQASFAMSKARLQITIHEYRRALQQASTALSAAKEHGFVPTNTTEG